MDTNLLISKANFIQFRKEPITNFYDFYPKVKYHLILRSWEEGLMGQFSRQRLRIQMGHGEQLKRY